MAETRRKYAPAMLGRIDVVSALGKDYVDHNHSTLLPKLKDKKQTALKDLESIRSEKEKLGRWPLSATLTAWAGGELLEPTGRPSRRGRERGSGVSLGARGRD